MVNLSTVDVDLQAMYWAVCSASTTAFEAWLRCIAPEVRVDDVATTSIHLPLVHKEMSAPTYSARVPGLTAEQAAEVIGRVLVTRPRTLVPWWVRVASPLADVVQGPATR